MRSKGDTVFTADFETTSMNNYINDGYVRVWLWSLVRVSSGEYWYGTTIESFINKTIELKCQKIYFHNLRFDGYFLLYGFNKIGWKNKEDYEVTIDKMNIWYQVKYHGITVWDSLKKFPGLSVESIGRMYGIGGKAPKPDFDRYIPEDYIPKPDEIKYCVRDSQIVAHALKCELENGHTGITLSYDAFKEVKHFIGFKEWRRAMPLLTVEQDDFCRRAYKGGYTYLNPKYAQENVFNVYVFDVNSLYPYVMRSLPLPIGEPTVEYEKPTDTTKLYIVHIITQFKLKEGYLPTIQIKHDLSFKETEYLTEVQFPVHLYLTSVDYDIFIRHYDIEFLSVDRYYVFDAKVGLLAPYIDKHMEDKIKASVDNDAPARYIAKRYLNSPYGKTGMRGDRINKQPIFDDEGVAYFEDEKTQSDTVYVPYAAFVCAWARSITINAAQKNYDKFIYCDTDSLHLVGNATGIQVHDYDIGKWKLEGVFKTGKYIRAKTYIHGDDDYNICEIKSAGMPIEVKNKVTWDEFKIGAVFDGKRMHKHVKGGCLIAETTFRIT